VHKLLNSLMSDGSLRWGYYPPDSWDNEEGIRITFQLSSFSKQYQRRQALKSVEQIVLNNKLVWITPDDKKWMLDLDVLRNEFSWFGNISWMIGKVKVEPEFEPTEKEVFGKPSYEANVVFYITPLEVKKMSALIIKPPIEIGESLGRFQKEYPDPHKAAFIMMQFASTLAHCSIVEGIRTCLAQSGIAGLRADNKSFHDDLFWNVLTYIWGCGFGIAVFERIKAEEFNPNVSLEVGYMLGVKKPICFLKDNTLKTLQTDLVGKLYLPFDPQDPKVSIPPTLTQWLKDKELG
jgi:hypothetical protein